MPHAEPNTPTWDMIPGALDTSLLAFERRPGVLHCNTYLLKTPEYVLIIDPGADESHAAATAVAARGLLRELPRQTAVCLTHCHLDHCAAMGTLLDACVPEATVICHHEADMALRACDPDMTLAALTGHDIPAIGHTMGLFAGPGPAGVTRAMDTPGGGLRSLSIPIGPRDALQAYHTPGHSPDSLCFRVGGALFAGDLPLAAGPGLMELPGYDGPQLEASLEKLLWLLDHCNITTVHPGHGRALNRFEARTVLVSLLDEIRGEADLLNRDQGVFAASLMDTCATQLETAGAGSMAIAARDIGRQFQAATTANTPHIEAARLVLRMDEVLHAPGTNGDLGNERPLYRARRRLNDFLSTLHGFRFADHAGIMEANITVARLLSMLADPPRFEGFKLEFRHCPKAPKARMDASILMDLLETALEHHAWGGASGAAIHVDRLDNAVTVAVTALDGTTELPMDVINYLRLTMKAYGGAFNTEPGRCVFAMTLVEDDS